MMLFRLGRLGTILVFAWAASGLQAQPVWQEEFAKMPLTEKTSELNRFNCARILVNSFQRNRAVQALIFMPGATDELYFFRRVHAELTNGAPTLLDAVIALTNQTYIRADVVAPFVVLHTAEDPLEPLVVIENQRMAERLHRKKFEAHVVFNDRDWNFVEPILAFDLDTRLLPGLHTHESNHFFRSTLAEFDLSGWDALRAMAMSGKTKFTVKKKTVVFGLDSRVLGNPPKLTGDFLFEK
jgi:hypothetical protein